MNYEVEQKFRLNHPAEMEAKLAALGARFKSPVEQIDHYFRHPARDFAQTDEALRLRQVGTDNFITYKGPKIDPASKTRRELELPLPPGPHTIPQFAELLTALGFSPIAIVTKHRRNASLHRDDFEVDCALDNVFAAGLFLELEITADDKLLESAKNSLTNLARHLGLGPTERRSYLEIIQSSAPEKSP